MGLFLSYAYIARLGFSTLLVTGKYVKIYIYMLKSNQLLLANTFISPAVAQILMDKKQNQKSQLPISSMRFEFAYTEPNSPTPKQTRVATQFDKPSKLLRRKNSILRSVVFFEANPEISPTQQNTDTPFDICNPLHLNIPFRFSPPSSAPESPECQAARSKHKKRKTPPEYSPLCGGRND